MLKLKTRRSLVCATILSLLVAIGLPTAAFAQNGRGRGSERRNERRYDNRYDGRDNRYNNYRREKRKSSKFINGHDARDGRWDGRGPRRNRSVDRAEWNNNQYRNSYRNRRRAQYRNYQSSQSNDSYYDNQTYSNGGASDVIGAILGNVLGGN